MLDLESLEKAIASFRSAIEVTKEQQWFGSLSQNKKNTVIAGVIQNFEFTYELCWKFMKRWLAENSGAFAGEGVSRRELFRLSAQSGLIHDVEKWMVFHNARNETSHTYSESAAEKIYTIAQEFFDHAQQFLSAIKKRND